MYHRATERQKENLPNAYFFTTVQKTRPDAERSALKDKLFNALCVTDFIGNQKTKNSEKGAPSTPFGVATEAIWKIIVMHEGCVPSPSLFSRKDNDEMIEKSQPEKPDDLENAKRKENDE